MTYQNRIELLVPVIGIIIAVISASLTYFFAKRKQILSDESRFKEKFYLNFIEAVSYNVTSNHTEKALTQLADAQNQLLLVANADVVSQLMIFHNYVKQSNAANYNPEKHDELLTNLLKSMRNDLYKNKKVNDGYPIIHLSGKPPKRKP